VKRTRVQSHCLFGMIASMLIAGCASTPSAPVAPQTPVPPTSAQAGDKTIIAIMAQPAPGAPIPSLPEFLGIPQVFKGGCGVFRFARDRITARLGGMFPGLEPRPPLLLITDPANLSPDAPPSVQAAAKIKQEQETGAQKAKAAAFLATVGCGCYEGVAEALGENLKDCNEEVRYATVKALREVGGKSCCSCGGNSCCTPEIRKSLMRLAWETDDTGCFVERSQRVRRLARLTLETCCGADQIVDETIPVEGPETEEGQLLSKHRRATGEVHAGAVATLTTGSGTALAGGPGLALEPTLVSESSLGATATTGADGVPAIDPESAEGFPESKMVAVLSSDGSSKDEGSVVQAASGPRRPLGRVLVNVNGEPITEEMLIPEVRRRMLSAELRESQAATDQGSGSMNGEPRGGDHRSGDGLMERHLREALAEAIDRKLLAQTARKVLSATVVTRIESEVAQASGDSIEHLFVDQGSRSARLETALGQELLRRQVDHDPYVAPHEIEAAYTKDQDRYREPDQYRWRVYKIDHQRVMQLGGATRAATSEMIRYVRLRETGFQTDPPAGFDDSYVTVERHDWMPLDAVLTGAIRDRLKGLRPGQASEVESTGSESSFVLVTHIRLGQLQSMKEVTPRIKAEVLARRRAEAEAAYIAQLRSRAMIRLLPDGELP
jgi:hypothetical protein